MAATGLVQMGPSGLFAIRGRMHWVSCWQHCRHFFLDCLAAPTGVDGALLQLGSTSPSASNALQEFQMDLLWPQWLGAQTGVNGSPVLPGSTWEAV